MARNAILLKDQIKAILEMNSESEGDDADSDVVDSDYDDHSSVVSESDDEMATDDVQKKKLYIEKRKFIDTPEPPRRIIRRNNESITNSNEGNPQVAAQNEHIYDFITSPNIDIRDSALNINVRGGNIPHSSSTNLLIENEPVHEFTQARARATKRLQLDVFATPSTSASKDANASTIAPAAAPASASQRRNEPATAPAAARPKRNTPSAASQRRNEPVAAPATETAPAAALATAPTTAPAAASAAARQKPNAPVTAPPTSPSTATPAALSNVRQKRNALTPATAAARKKRNATATAPTTALAHASRAASTTAHPAAPTAAPVIASQNTYIAKDNTIWDKIPPIAGRARLYNIRRDNGPRPNVPDTIAITNPIDTFMLYLRPVLGMIVLYTNMKAVQVHRENNYAKNWVDVDEKEMKAFIGILIVTGVLKQSKVAVNKLWNKIHGSSFCRATMSQHRFKQILRYIRFDNTELRDPTDKFAPIRVVWEKSNAALLQYYIPSDNFTVDEQLLAYRGRCGFKQYMPSKPDKYGIKFWWAVDSETYYPLNSLPYLERVGNERAVGLGSQVVLKLSEPFFESGRNVTCDNFFTTYDLSITLLEKRLTLVGTLKKNKTFLPEEFKPQNSRPVGSSVFGFQHDVTIVSYVPKERKSVALLSTLHHTDKVDENTGKPEIILDYNATKGGVDTVDQMAHSYSCKRGTRRWPLAVFFNLIDIIGIASYVLFCQKYNNWHRNRNDKRSIYLQEVANSLVQEQLTLRYERCHQDSLKITMVHVMQAVNPTALQANNQAQQEMNRRRRRCHICPSSKHRKNTLVCDMCIKPICKEHSKERRMCHNCQRE